MSSTPSPREASPTRIEVLSAVLAAAFEDDPIFGWLLPDPTRRRSCLVRFFGLELRHLVFPAGRVWTMEEETVASLELPPGRWKMPLGTQLRLIRELTRVFGARLPRAIALNTLMERRHPRQPHYYIPYVGVAPHAQGQGLGSALLRPTLERCDRERVPAYLEATSERNAGLYLRLGFQHLGEFKLASSPPLWPMRRPPAEPS